MSAEDQAELRALFQARLKGKNLMTPDVIRYGVSGPYAYELSEGEGFSREPIYGVTVLLRGSGERRNDLSKCVYSLAGAEAYIREIGALK